MKCPDERGWYRRTPGYIRGSKEGEERVKKGV